MFLVSKLFWLIAQPLSLAFFLVLSSIFLGLFHCQKMSVASAFGAALVLFVTLFTTTGSYLLQGLEARIPASSRENREVRCMIVLGGAFETEVTTARGGIEFNGAADRFVEALRLARDYPGSRIVVSGGDGSLSGDYEGDAAAAERFFAAFGVAPARLIKEARSRTTFENARNTKALLESEGLKDCLLVTSAFHMPRSVGLFRKLGIDVVPWPVDYRTSGKVRLGLDFTQPTLNAQQTATAIREWIGLVAYYATDRTSVLYPS
ncbi:YdcF family protein [Rhizobiaceae bacterium n13]|uniref:YdcF family protein n=1 Tax=Ferirhizobium litorale TaxID=2927786 RepID=A0AAE3QJ34_9HYPH|nr:ElyC/SanA/YdcF family protein [Fererhizobium litorale]MDI7862948.1 YdcF family protein [Fererhizobium litorale]MDI7924033.1 YdcF family protein [Fererhizobium litorale]